MNTDCDKDDEFKVAFKYYKQRKVAPSLEDVIDFKNRKNFSDQVSEVDITKFAPISQMSPNCKIACQENWKAYELLNVPGLIYICNVFSKENQEYWCRQCLENYSRYPCVTNLDTHYPKEHVDEMWTESKETINNCEEGSNLRLLKSTPIWNLRWSTLGYHYGWGTKSYQKEKKCNFPKDLFDVFSYIAESMGFSSYKPEAAIINYYHDGSRLTPHNDISEADLERPIISINFGLSSIFLIGGETRDVKPTALIIRPGDSLIMSGKSRVAFHAIPKVLPHADTDKKMKDPLSLYMHHTRININSRQVESEHCPL